MKRIKQQNLFYYSLLFMAIALPFSVALTSVAVGVCLLAGLVSADSYILKIEFNQRKYFIFISSVFIFNLFGGAFSHDFRQALNDVNKSLPFLLIPLAFLLSPQLSLKQERNVLVLFTIAVIFASLTAMFSFYFSDQPSVLDAQYAGFIHHIRFSFMVIMAIAILMQLIVQPFEYPICIKVASGFLCAFLIVFLFWHQSLTGVAIFLIIGLSAGFYFFVKRSKGVKRAIGVAVFLLTIIFCSCYVLNVVHDFYSKDQIDAGYLPKYTSRGNLYHHDLSNPFTENGHFIGLNLCEKELRESWNERSKLDYDSLDTHKNRLKDTLIRYLTSRNLSKDADGMDQLSNEEIRWIESGISNYVLASRKLSLYPRLYVSIWEIDRYLKSGNSNQKSLAQRVEFSRAAWMIFQKHWLLGVGPGNWKEAHRKAYHAMGSQMDEALYADAHNQYLAYLVRFGTIGTLLIFLFILYPVVKFKAYRNPLFGVLLAVFLLGNFSDSNFDRYIGACFFLFFYCLFLSRNLRSINAIDRAD